MNSDNAQRVVALRDGGTNQIVAIGFKTIQTTTTVTPHSMSR